MGWERKRGKLAEFNRFLRGGAQDALRRDRRRRGAAPRACATSSRSTPTRCCRPTRRRCWSARSRIRSTARSTIRRWAASSAATASCSRASACRCRARTARASPRSTPDTRASIRTRPRCPTSTRTCTARAASPARAIYDVDAFEQATHGRFPENTLLSHDLIEGSYARAGLATDVIVYDDYPTPLPDATRAASTAGSAATGSCCRGSRRGCRARRAGAQPAVAALALEDLRQPAPQHGRDRAAALPRRGLDDAARLAAALDAARPRRDRRAVDRLAAARRCSGRRSTSRGARTTPPSGATRSPARSRSALAIAFLPHQAWVSADAIVAHAVAALRVAAGICSSGRPRRRPSGGMARLVPRGVAGACGPRWRSRSPILAALRRRWPRRPTRRGMARGRAAAARPRSGSPRPRSPTRSARRPCRASSGSARSARAPGAALRAAALALLRPVRQRGHPLARAGQLPGGSGAGRGDAHVAHQHRSAAARHRERARPRLHHARGHGHAGWSARSARWSGMRRFRGHFYNWYDLHDLRVLEPAYVSTVDSGNLAGHLIALRQACLALADRAGARRPRPSRARWRRRSAAGRGAARRTRRDAARSGTESPGRPDRARLGA